MYNFHYKYMFDEYKTTECRLYTDNFVYEIFTKNFYSDIKPDIDGHFDTSNFSPNNIFHLPLKN
jgi:hypothetical protein